MRAYQPERLNQNSAKQNSAVELVQRHPALCAGAAMSVVVMSTIFINAVWYQNGTHPAPLFATRTIEQVTPIKEEKKVVAKVTENPVVKEVPVDETTKELLREVQTALSVRGYYQGKLDGVYGSRTNRAISKFQKDHSLEEDGKASVRLLTQVLLSASAKPAEVPVPKNTELAQKPGVEKSTTVVTSKSKEPKADGLIARIQSGLRSYGYDDLIVDGQMGQQTATAIQRFQLDYGMKITGEPSDRVLQKLQDIGAYNQG